MNFFTHRGVLLALAAYVSWGMFPFWFKAVQHVPAEQVLIHRILWSFVFLAAFLLLRWHWTWLPQALRQPRLLAGFTASALLLSTNWFIYIWSVHQDRIVDASLGYFMTPLVNVLLGLLLLKERLRVIQWMAVALAAAGVAWLTWHSGQVPWIGLSIALTFGTYGLLRKTAPLGALEGLTLETLIMLPLAGIALLLLDWAGNNAFAQASISTKWLLASAGPVTAIPLLLFAAGARRIPLSTLGLLQYIAPTLQLLIGVWIFHEPFSGNRLIGFMFIWAGLALYSVEGAWRWSRVRPE